MISDDELISYKNQLPKIGKFTRRMAIEMADFFNVTPKFIVKRLEAIGQLKRGSWDWFVENGGITRDHVLQVRAERAAPTPEAENEVF